MGEDRRGRGRSRGHGHDGRGQGDAVGVGVVADDGRTAVVPVVVSLRVAARTLRVGLATSTFGLPGSLLLLLLLLGLLALATARRAGGFGGSGAEGDDFLQDVSARARESTRGLLSATSGLSFF